MRLLSAISIVLLFTAFSYGQVPYKFSAGSAAKAAEVNANDSFLLAKITALQLKCDSVANDRRVQDSLNSPKGIIVASLVAPDLNGWMPNTNHTWAVCDGDPAKKSLVIGIGLPGDSIPDLRGVFLRGLDFISSGRPTTGLDPDATRAAGSYQVDAFASHAHGTQGYVSLGGNPVDNFDHGPFSLLSSSGTSATGGPETRPRNVAVYYYIKVK
jgi:hypothetical protein